METKQLPPLIDMETKQFYSKILRETLGLPFTRMETKYKKIIQNVMELQQKSSTILMELSKLLPGIPMEKS